MSTRTLTGACLCGKITYAIDLPATDPNPKVILCHCTTCKRYTGGGFSTNIVIPKPALRWTSTPPKVYLDPSTDSGNLLRRELCGECGCHLTSPPSTEVTAVKWGTLDEESRAQCQEFGGEIYCKRKDQWVGEIGREGALRVEGMM